MSAPAASLQQDVYADSFIASTHGLGIDNLLNFYAHSNNEEEKNILKHFIQHTQMSYRFAQPYNAAAAASLLQAFLLPGFIMSITITCPGFLWPAGPCAPVGLIKS